MALRCCELAKLERYGARPEEAALREVSLTVAVHAHGHVIVAVQTLDLSPEEQVFEGICGLKFVESKLDVEALINVECDGAGVTEVLNGVT